MAQVEISFFSTGNRSREGGSMPVPHGADLVTEVLVAGAVSVATRTGSPQPAGSGFVRIRAAADVWVGLGADPVAVAPAAGEVRAGLRVAAGVPCDLAVSAGDRVAVVVPA